MKPIVEELIDLYQKGNFRLGEEKCLSYVDDCKKKFAEELTVNSATDFAGSVILFSQFCSGEKKPWKAIPVLLDGTGCFRFLEDFMQDREMFANTSYSVASALLYAGLAGKASTYFEKCIMYSTDPQILENSAYYFIYCCLKAGFDLDNNRLKLVRDHLSQERTDAILKEAEEVFFNQIKTDPLEREEVYLENLYEIENEIDARLKEHQDSRPFCIQYWECKKEVLKERLNLDWKSPEECNPNIRFQ